MNLANAIHEYVDAAFSGIYIQSFEHDDAIHDIAGLCAKQGWIWSSWDITEGLAPMGMPAPDDSPDPIAAIKSINALRQTDSDKAGLLILRNFHRFLDNPEVLQALDRAISSGKKYRTFIIILAPVLSLPIELQKQFVVVEHQLPDRAEMDKIISGVATEAGDLPDGGPSHILDAAAGLTRMEAERAFALSIVRHGQIRPETVWEIKSAMLKKSGLLNLHEGKERFDGLGGLDNLKSFCKRALTNTDRHPLAKPKGVLMLGVPGSGKSAFAKALGNEVQRPTITLDVGALMGSLVGETERNTRLALSIVDAMSPCVVMVDEVEKALAGAAGGGQGDSGVGARMFGTLLTWMNDHTSDVFLVMTANDISKLPPEFSRAERFDAIFFVDLPTARQKEIIWDMYEKMFEIEGGKKKRPADKDWTGAEIRACCRLAAMLNISLQEAALNIVPVAVTAGEKVEQLRTWATGRCLSSETSGLYHSDAATVAGATTGRSNIKRPSSN